MKMAILGAGSIAKSMAVTINKMSEVKACIKAIQEGKLECDEMPHSETIRVMKIMDSLRKEWGIVYPCE